MKLRDFLIKICEYIIVLSVILASGAVFGYLYLNYIWIGQFGLVCFLFILKKEHNFSRRHVLTFVIVLLLLIVNALVVSDCGWNNAIVFFINIVFLFATSAVIEKETYVNDYINWILVISIISLITFLLSQKGILIGSKNIIASSQIWHVSKTYHVYAKTRLFGITPRNSGIFWEPGAYQIFLNLALLFLLEQKAKLNKFSIIKAILIAVSIISTYSATAYITLAVVFAIYFINRRKQNIITITFIVIPFILLLLLFTSNSSIVSEKMNSKNESFSQRYTDVQVCLSMISKKPFLGFGYNSAQMTAMMKELGAPYSSVGVLNFAIMFGVPLTIGLFGLMVKSIKSCLCTRDNNFITYILLIVFLMVVFGTEHIMIKEVFLIFIFQFPKEKADEELLCNDNLWENKSNEIMESKVRKWMITDRHW